MAPSTNLVVVDPRIPKRHGRGRGLVEGESEVTRMENGAHKRRHSS